MNKEALDAMSPVTYWSSAFAFVSSVTLPEWVAVTSIIVAITGLIVTWYYKHKQYQFMIRSGK